MQDLRECLANLECVDVATYIQSGNAVFRHAGLADTLSRSISEAVESGFGFRPAVMLLTGAAFAQIAAANPYLADGKDPKHVYTWFLGSPATDTDLNGLKAIALEDEQFVLTDAAFYLFTPHGIGRSKLAAAVERRLGVPTTARNSRTIGKIAELLSRLEPTVPKR